MWSRLMSRVSLGVFLASSSGVWAHPPQFVECPELNFLAPACDVPAEEVEQPPAPPVPEPPLFTLQTMRPDTPPLMLKAMNDLTDATIDAYLDWEQRYLARAFEFEARVKHRRQQRQR